MELEWQPNTPFYVLSQQMEQKAYNIYKETKGNHV